MAGLTLTQARTATSRMLNDTAKTRYSDADDIDPALELALSSLLTEYADEGGDFFLTELTGTTVSGVLDLSSSNILFIHKIQMVQGNRRYPILRAAAGREGTLAEVAEDLIITATVEPAFPTVGGDPLYDHSSAFQAFDNLVCVRAALHLSAGEDRPRQSLMLEDQRLTKSVMSRKAPAGPSVLPLPRSDYGYRFSYRPDNRTLYLRRRRW